ncbi:hypothetical protein O181_002315 [Austropuccinia psidii MF-1]|uniref:Uncharacterized protein n=1 Tax=Austropuccinia psidii MF-1 TaxID=1389203 RepID=A0A9Q3BCT3_9BASI|nr:hypothetical protein [Austropuccinia psidii MF-1]
MIVGCLKVCLRFHYNIISHLFVCRLEFLTTFDQDAAEPPSKVVSSIEEIEVYCKVLNIDLDGKADGSAWKTMIPQIDPKTAVLVDGVL